MQIVAIDPGRPMRLGPLFITSLAEFEVRFDGYERHLWRESTFGSVRFEACQAKDGQNDQVVVTSWMGQHEVLFVLADREETLGVCNRYQGGGEGWFLRFQSVGPDERFLTATSAEQVFRTVIEPALSGRKEA